MGYSWIKISESRFRVSRVSRESRELVRVARGARVSREVRELARVSRVARVARVARVGESRESWREFARVGERKREEARVEVFVFIEQKSDSLKKKSW
jgi:hypothetical protein